MSLQNTSETTARYFGFIGFRAGWYAALVMVLTLAGCAPRGDSHSVDEVLSASRDRLTTAIVANTSSLPANFRDDLKGVVGELDKFSGEIDASATKQIAETVSSKFSTMITRAGYTSRPALTEIYHQFDHLASTDGLHPTASTRKLLAARAYSILSAELETTHFSL